MIDPVNSDKMSVWWDKEAAVEGREASGQKLVDANLLILDALVLASCFVS